jgi:type III secretion protein Q
MSLAEALSNVETLPNAVEWPPRVAPDEVAALNALHRRRGAAEFTLGGRRALFELLPNEEPPLVDGPAFRLSLGGATIVARPPAACLARLLQPVGLQVPVEMLDPAAAALLLEFAALGDIERLEKLLGTSISVVERNDATFLLRGQEIAARLELDDASHNLRLWLDRDAMLGLGAALDRLAPPPEPLDLPHTVRVCMGWRAVGVGDLRDLGRGDVVILEPGRGMSGPVAVLGDRLAARLRAEAGRLVAAARFAPIVGSNWEWSMDASAEVPKRLEGLDEAELDALPVKLVFELGRAEMTLGEIKRVAAGAVIPLSRPLDEAVDIVANGRRIGQGSIVRIGDALGVRVERLTADG